MSTMFVVSCRKDFWSATEFSPKDEIRELDLDNGNGPVITPAAFLGAMAQKRITVLVHGYNNERLDVLASYRTIDAQMRLLGFLGAANRPYDALVGFAWPGGATGVSFPFARGRADDTAPRFGRLLADLRGRGATVDLNTHSLGAHVSLEALREASSQVVRNAWNFASAVDNESINKGSATSTPRNSRRASTSFTPRTTPCCRCGIASATFSISTRRSDIPGRRIRARSSIIHSTSRSSTARTSSRHTGATAPAARSGRSWRRN